MLGLGKPHTSEGQSKTCCCSPPWLACQLEMVPAGLAVPALLGIPEEMSPHATALSLARVPRRAPPSPVPSWLGCFGQCQ